jgi:hypothetical protein
MPFTIPINVFLSSTYLDLKEHRNQARDEMDRFPWLNRNNHMESSPAQSENLTEGCMRTVRESQIYVALVASRAGRLFQDEQGRDYSLTQLEYREACRFHLYRIILLNEEIDRRAADNIDFLEMFRAELGNLFVGSFKTNDPSSVKLPIHQALSKARGVYVNSHIALRMRVGYHAITTDHDVQLRWRRLIATIAGLKNLSWLWLCPFGSPDAETTVASCFLPMTCKLQFLDKRPTWPDEIVDAVDIPETDPRLVFAFAGLGSRMSGSGSLNPVRRWLRGRWPRISTFWV